MTSNESQRGAFSAQQYRVIADRDKGDDPRDVEQCPGDRLIYSETVGAVLEGPILVRIERPVPTTDEPPATYQQGYDDGYLAGEYDANNKPSVPTREQIASLDGTDLANWAQERTGRSIWPSTAAAVRDAVLALLNGADRD